MPAIGDDDWHLHRAEIERRMTAFVERNRLSALAAAGPENVYFVSGYPSRALYRYPLAGRAMAAFVPGGSPQSTCILSDFEAPSVPDTLAIGVASFATWMDIDDPLGLIKQPRVKDRPSEFQMSSAFATLNEVLRAGGVTSGRVGIDAALISVAGWNSLHKANPAIEFVDLSKEMFELRLIKTRWEIDCLRLAAQTAERGLATTAENIRIGSTESDLVRTFRQAIDSDPVCDRPGHAQVLVGPTFAPTHLPQSIPAKAGAVIELDVGTQVLGYTSDIARTFVLGEPPEMLKRIYGALRAGHDHLLDNARPGVPMREVYEGATAKVLKSGIENYSRGHLGHSIGLDIRVEEPPVVGPMEERVIEPNMVLCLETPYYAHGIGGVSIEDMVLITETGIENLITLSRDIGVIA
jgi:Xaa-Pro aminopeptidase